MKKSPSSGLTILRSLSASCFLLMVLPAVAQQVAPAPDAPPAKTVKPEDIIELPPFEVRTDKDEGYLAQNTASGSRLNTSLKDTPSPISVFTEMFLKDIGATDISELSDYASGTERLNGLQGDVAGGNEFAGGTADLRVRGLPSTRMVNFFARTTEVDTFDTDRVELARGGNALLFGPGSGGGVFNVSTKKADLNRQKNSASYRFGDFDQSRATVDFNLPLVPGVAALRLNAVTDAAGSWRAHEGRKSDRMAVAGRWQIASKLLLNIEYEANNISVSKHRIWGTYDSYTDWNKAGRKVDPKVAAPGETLVQTRNRLGISASAVSTATVPANFWVWNSTDGALINYSSPLAANAQSRSANTVAPVPALGSTVAGNTNQENPMLLDFSVVPKAVAVYGDGIGNLSDVDVATASLTYEPIKDLFVELAYNRQESASLSYDSTEFARVQWDTSPTTVTGVANPHLLQPFIEMTPTQRTQNALSDDVRLTGSYDFNLGKGFGRHRLATALERLDQEQDGAGALRKLVVSPAVTTTADNAANTLRYRTYVDLAGPPENIAVFNFREDPSGRSAWVPATNIANTRRLTDTVMTAMQSYFWNDRLITTLGYRKDWIDSYDSTTSRIGSTYNGVFAQGDLVATRNARPAKSSGTTRSLGAVFHANSWLSLFANKGTTFSLPNATNRIERDTPAPQTIGESQDYGVKLSLRNDRVFATATYFETASFNDTGSLNVPVTQANINAIWDSLNTVMAGDGSSTPLAANGINYDSVHSNVNAFTFDSKSQGWEFEVTANPTRNLRLSFGFSDRVTRRSDMGVELLSWIDGYRPLWNQYATRLANGQTIATRLANVDADHAIRLLLPDGKQLLGSSRQTARLRANYAFSRENWLKGFSLGGGVRWNGDAVVGYDLNGKNLEAKRSTIVDLLAAYRTKFGVFGRKLDLEFQVNANNVFDEDDIVVTRLYTNNGIRTYEFQNPRQIFFTTTLSF